MNQWIAWPDSNCHISAHLLRLAEWAPYVMINIQRNDERMRNGLVNIFRQMTQAHMILYTWAYPWCTVNLFTIATVYINTRFVHERFFLPDTMGSPSRGFVAVWWSFLEHSWGDLFGWSTRSGRTRVQVLAIICSKCVQTSTTATSKHRFTRRTQAKNKHGLIRLGIRAALGIIRIVSHVEAGGQIFWDGAHAEWGGIVGLRDGQMTKQKAVDCDGIFSKSFQFLNTIGPENKNTKYVPTALLVIIYMIFTVTPGLSVELP